MAFLGNFRASPWKITTFILFVVVLIYTSALEHQHNTHKYTNSWAIHLPNADHERANTVAKRHGMINLGQVGSLEGFYHFKHPAHPQRMKREIREHTVRLASDSEVKWVEQQVIKRRVKRDSSVDVMSLFSDNLWKQQWYLHNNGFDHNVIPVWKELNITGRGVSVSILDDGIEKDHPDLIHNYDPEASFDYNSHDSDPSPRMTYNNENRHGTRCAGEVAAAAGNGVCGVGVAYGAKIGGIRMLDGDVTDLVEANSLSFKPDHIDVYSASWGPDDDGKTVDGPGVLAKKAFEDGIVKGRDGLGNIFVWASGNGGREDDNCNCDGYTNSIFTVSISSATIRGTVPWYSERCASTLASTFSSGAYMDKQIVTTDLHHQCTVKHTGTSASAPLAAGLLALALEANPKLTWRDMQHIVLRTSTTHKLETGDWVTNGVGRKVSHRFGYGLLDAKAMVQAALTWKTVPKQHTCDEPPDTTPRLIPSTGSLVVSKKTEGCMNTEQAVRYLEHVEVVITLSFPRRGDLSMYLTSPSGTRSTILDKRKYDSSNEGFNAWRFMSTHTWQENPNGTWSLEIENGGGHKSGHLASWQLRFHGTLEHPTAGYDNCASECKNGCHGPKASDCNECVNYKANGVCVNQCPSHTFTDLHTKECLNCHSSCVKCWGPGERQCRACSPPKLLQSGTCVDSCSERWFGNASRHCEPCNKQCKSCDRDASNCTACEEDHRLINNDCIITCKTNDYVENDRCQPCHPSCATCKNGTAWTCTACGITKITRESPPQALYLHMGMCVAECPSGFYGNNHVCLPCHASCKHCSGSAPTDCTSCKNGLVKVTNGSNLCLDSCPNGFSHGISENTCVKCYLHCTACDPLQPARCTACEQGRFLWKQQCVDVCPNGTYEEVKSRKCDYCHPSCAACVDVPTQCARCPSDLYLHGSSCVASCPVGTVGVDRKCLPCRDNCSNCFGVGLNQCLECSTGLFSLDNKCVKECPKEMFVEKSSGKCQYCSITCDGCVENASNCLTCKDGLKKASNGQCEALCEYGTFHKNNTSTPTTFINVNSTTKINHSSYTTRPTTPLNVLNGNGNMNVNKNNSNINGNSSNNNNNNNNGNSYIDNSTNSNSDSIGTNVENNDNSNNGDNNNGDDDDNTGNNGSNTSDVDDNIDNINNENTYIDNIHNRNNSNHNNNNNNDNNSNSSMSSSNTSTDFCAGKCHASCITCIGPSKYDCLRCKGVKFHDPLTKLCSFDCPETGFYSDIDSTLCKRCQPECLKCSDHTTCTKCASGLALYGKKCLARCPDTFYREPSSSICLKCDAKKCKQCSRASTNCVSCPSPGILLHGACVTECPAGMFMSHAFNRCLPCESSCKTCAGPGLTHCTSCEHPMVLFQAQCRTICPTRYYYNHKTKQCEPCDYYCQKCSGGNGLSSCTKCIPSFVLHRNMCVRTCPEGYVLEASKGQCVACHKSCATCLGPSEHDCLTCRDVTASFDFGVCKQGCGTGEYRVSGPTAAYCEKCHPSCKTCVGPGPLGCSACFAGSALHSSQCVSGCPNGQYVSSGTCYMCSTPCKTCKGPSSDDCLSCNDEHHFLYNFTCVKRCPPSTYRETSNGLNECRRCHASCATCTDKGADHCVSCRVDLYLEKTTCLKQCSINYRLNENTRTCKLCDADCPGYANVTDRSVQPGGRPNDHSTLDSKIHSRTYFALVVVATAVTLLAMLALYIFLKGRSKTGYTQVVEKTADTSEPVVNNNLPEIYIHDRNMERQPMLDYEESGL